MSRSRSLAPPKYRKHRQSGQALVTLTDPSGRRRDYTLGPYGSPESKREYTRLIAEWTAADHSIPATGDGPVDLTVNELILKFWSQVQQFYRHPDGRPTGEVDSFKLSLRPVRQLYGHTQAKDFGPLSLKAVRTAMVNSGLSRKVVNQRVGRVRRMFKWAVSEQLIPPQVYHGLQSVEGLARGRSTAPERPPVQPVDDATVEKTLAVLNRHVAGMIRVQRLTGCRPQDVCGLRWCDINMSGAVWIYKPSQHKGAWRGAVRTVYLGPQAQAILAGFRSDDRAAYVFSPRQAREEQYAAMRANRKTKVQPSQVCRKKAKAKRLPGEYYTPKSYHKAIDRACKLHGIEPWAPNRLRHARGSEIRRLYGLEEAQVSLGHARADVTQIYAQRNGDLAIRVALETG
jgi:integrase